MNIELQYGRSGLSVDLPANNVTVLRPQFVPGLPDEGRAFREAVRQPLDGPPLASLIGSEERVAVVIADATRALPSHRILPWLLAELAHVPAENFTIVIGTGTHRACPAAEVEALVGPDIARRLKVINHNAYDPDCLETVGQIDGQPLPLQFNREYVQADKRILIGFIEPHFMAGFSGGFKAVFPGVAGLAAIMYYHRAEIIGHPRSTWGILQGNPTQTQIRAYGAALPVDFCINVTLNHQHQITRYFCGPVLVAHDTGCRFARETAMVACGRPFPIVVTSNSGYPLDQNLYQTVKGICAAAEIVSEGGLIITAARCNDGFPDHGNFTRLLLGHDSPQAILDTVYTPGFHKLDQWQVQKLAQVQLKARLALYSELPASAVARVRLQPIADLNEYLADVIAQQGPDTPIAVLPEGPMTIPYLERNS